MINPLSLINNDISRLILQSRNIFEMWTDSNSSTMDKECISVIKRNYNTYVSSMNTQMRIYMIAQKEIEDAMQRLTQLYLNLQ